MALRLYAYMRQHDALETPNVRFEYLCSRMMRTREELAACESVGYHGTSVESLLMLVNAGSLPGGTIGNPRSGDTIQGRFYFFPFGIEVESSSDRVRSASHVDEPLALIEQASHYAHIVASTHSLLTALHLDPTQSAHRQFADNILYQYEPTNPDELQEFEKIYDTHVAAAGLSFQDLSDLRARCLQRFGIVLSLSPTVQRDFDFYPGDPGEHDAYIVCPDGLQPSYFSEIWFPHGEERAEFLQRARGKGA